VTGDSIPVTREYPYALDYDDPVLAELYDKYENYLDDVHLIRKLFGDSKHRKILEPFSGTGRILIQLAFDGHQVEGIDIARSMVERARSRLEQLGNQDAGTFTLHIGDALTFDWGRGFDLVILGSNCFYELTSAEQQKHCIQKASRALSSGAYVFVDNDHYRGDWARDTFPQERVVFEGLAKDGTFGRLVLRSLGFDEEKQLLRMHRIWSKQAPNGTKRTIEYTCGKRPVSGTEVLYWLEKNDFRIELAFGNRSGEQFSDDSERAIFWARKL
jgi:SAM-dependent methyltransferase